MAKKAKKAKQAKAKKSGSKGMAKARAKKAAPKKVSPVPAGYHTITPYLVCKGAADAMAFYKKAFGAKERLRMGSPDGRIAHAEMMIGSSMLMLGDEYPEMGAVSPQTVGGTGVHVFLYLPNIDKAFARALAAGATAEMPPTDMFWGDRYAKLSDPFGHKWSMATHIEDVSPKEMARRGAEAMAQQGPPQG
jgi:uncharacterized glyoxalase superfamily protein PhnB